MQWTVVMALKSIGNAKSRLRAASRSDREHEELVAAIRADTLDAVRGAPSVAELLVVSDEAAGGIDLVQHEPGLNAAFAEGVTYLRQGPIGDVAVVAMVGDLAALRAADFEAMLIEAATTPRGFVADTDGHGTTLVTARAGEAITPSFGPGSAHRHARTMTALPVAANLRCDIDTPEDLAAAVAIGVGPHTRALLAYRMQAELT